MVKVTKSGQSGYWVFWPSLCVTR